MIYYAIIAIAFAAGMIHNGASIATAGAAGAAWPFYLAVAVYNALKKMWDTLE